MVTAPKPQRASNGFAVIRHYEPTRIERELLAQVFDVVSRGAIADLDDVERPELGMNAGVSQPAVDGLLHVAVEQVDARRHGQLERAA